MTGPRLLAGRYRMESLLGTGGMAAVWRAHDERLDRPVAVKELTGDGLVHLRAQERFEREARAVARMAHPNIVGVFDFGTEDGQPYLVMELVEGRTVAELLADGPLPVADALAVAAQTCDGLAAAHAAGIVHRDIKPANLIVTPTGVVKIFDFGIARYMDGATNPALTASSVAMGSATYMSPEQLDNRPIDGRTDLYALGCSLYEMLSGAPPFSGDTALSVAHQHVTKVPTPLRVDRPDLPSDLDALVTGLLAKQAGDRPGDAGAVRRRLAALAATQPPPTLVAPVAGALAAAEDGGRPVPTGGSASPPDPSVPAYPPPAPGQGRRARRAVLVGVLLLVVAALAVAGLLARQDGDPVVTTAPSSTPAASPTPSPSPSPSPSASAPSRSPSPRTSTRPPSPSRSPVDPIVAMRLAIQHQVDLGNLNADTARDLNHMVDDLAKSVATGNTGDEQKKLKALNDKLSSLSREGKLSADGYRALKRALDNVAAAVL